MRMAKENIFKSKEELATRIFKECKKIEKRRDITPVERNNIKYVRTLIESTFKNPSDEVLLSNLLISLRGIIESRKIDEKNLVYFQNSLSKLEQEEREKKRDRDLESLINLFKSDVIEDRTKGFTEMSQYVKQSWRDEFEIYVPEAVKNMSSDQTELALSSGIFVLECCSYKPDIYKKFESTLLSTLNSADPQIKAIIILMCSRVGATKAIQELIKYSDNDERINLRKLNIPDYMIKFKHNGDYAYLNDMVRDAIFTIVDSTNDPSNYVKMSVSYSLSGLLREGEEFSLVFKIRPIVDMENLVINLNGLLGSFDVVGQTKISLSNLKINDYRELESRLIPETSGHLKGTVELQASDLWRGELTLDAIFERKINEAKKETSVIVHSSDTEEPSVKATKPEQRRENSIDILIKDIQTMEVRKVVNAIDELKNYVKGDENLENRLSALSVNFSLRGTDKITRVEMENVIEIAENIRHRS
ncbi:MAG: seg [Thermoplasmatales archaeon Gpl]|jgi:hypothetical protein|uniref:Uncharacterized protein n=2 Tax=Cuniculiplasma divulgatum TaxID=1673428 RepID=A0A1R4A7L5_9ARCH|nr:MAG: seg [Thermoplasmatales archaeon Gpl]SJK84967.1 hypothetical protein CPM_1156 [Cuniculiplasma divulgatum]